VGRAARGDARVAAEAAREVDGRGARRRQQVKLALTPPDGAADPGLLRFFPFQEGRIEASSPQTVSREGAAYVLALPVAYQLAPGFTRVAGVISAAGGIGDAKAATIDVPLAGAVVAGPKPVDAKAPTLVITSAERARRCRSSSRSRWRSSAARSST
jgi:hypothetical protein